MDGCQISFRDCSQDKKTLQQSKTFFQLLHPSLSVKLILKDTTIKYTADILTQLAKNNSKYLHSSFRRKSCLFYNQQKCILKKNVWKYHLISFIFVTLTLESLFSCHKNESHK